MSHLHLVVWLVVFEACCTLHTGLERWSATTTATNITVTTAVTWSLLPVLLLADREGYSCTGNYFNPFSPESRQEQQQLWLLYNVETGMAWNPATQVSKLATECVCMQPCHADSDADVSSYNA
jgi:hypothetical protein